MASHATVPDHTEVNKPLGALGIVKPFLANHLRLL